MGPGKKNLKATKKFEKNRLQGVLDKRNATAKVRQRQQMHQKKKARNAKDAEFFKKAGDGKPAMSFRGKPRAVHDMSVDDFFSGGFEDIVGEEESKKRKRDAPKDEEEDHDEEEQEDDEEGEANDVEDSDDSLGRQPVEASDSEDEDDEEGGMSKETMDALAEKDPEFYKFLKENDPEALDFDLNADLAEVDELSGGDDDESEDEEPKKKKKKVVEATEDDDEDEEEQDAQTSNELTRPVIAKWRKAMTETKSLRAARQVVLAFRCAAHLNEEEDESLQKWTINDPEVFNDILVLALKQIPEVMNHHLPVKESSSGKVYVQTESKKFRTLSLLLKTYISSIMHLLSTLSDDKTLKLTLSSITPILPYLLSFKKLIKALAKSVVNFWAQPASTETTRITAFLVLGKLVVIGDKGIRETVLKATYQGLVQGCRVTNHNTIAGINLMKNSAAELWGIDPGVGYTTAFTFIRQLAIHLRNSIVNNKNDSFRLVYNWQFTHSLDFWSCVLAHNCTSAKEAEAGKESQLKLLVYPLVQVTLGAMRLIPTALYFPQRFHLVRSLLRTSRATDTFIPLASPLLEVLSSAEMKKAPKATTLKALDFAVAYKAPKSYLRTRVYQDGVGEQVVELLGEYLFLWAKSIAFPELALPVIIQLKRWMKQARSKSQGNKNTKLVTQMALLVQKVEANAKFVEDKRSTVDFAPKDRAQVESFLRDTEPSKTPLGAYIVGQRKSRAEKAKMLELARAEDDKKRREDERAALDENEFGSDEDMEADDDDDEEEEEEDIDMMGEDDDEDDEEEEDDE